MKQMDSVLTNAQQLILEVAEHKDMIKVDFQNHWVEYSEYYNDYNDCHGDYYDAE